MAWGMMAPLDHNRILLWSTPLAQFDPAALVDLLSDDERQRAERLIVPEARRRYVVARAMLRRLLAGWLEMPPQLLRFGYGAHGKPVLEHPAGSDLRFNLSHSANLALFAIARGREVGVDLERVRELPNAEALAARYFAPEEQAVWKALPAAERLSGFFAIWTRKEALLKAQGSGIAGGLGRFAVGLEAGPAPLLRDDTPSAALGWRVLGLEPAPGYLGALSAPGEWQAIWHHGGSEPLSL